MIGIVDYNAGNIKSVERALAALGVPFVCSKNPRDLEQADKLIFPGVGDAAFAMRELAASGYDTFLRESAAAGVPILGICLGSQIIFDFSEEGDTPCLGLVPGTVRHFESLYREAGVNPRELGLKVPHMGWSTVTVVPPTESSSALGGRATTESNPALGAPAEGATPKAVPAPADFFAGKDFFAHVPDNSDFYFVHSYVLQPASSADIAGVAQYGITVPSVICHGNITATQFHPEKSGPVGLTLLRNFVGDPTKAVPDPAKAGPVAPFAEPVEASGEKLSAQGGAPC